MRRIDVWIFGSGSGLGMPFWDQAVYWLCDTSRPGSRSRGRGAFYTWIGGFGAQLQSFQWTHPRPQERRTLAGVEFKPFHSNRSCGRVRVSWATVRAVKDAADIRSLEARLGDSGNDYVPWQPPSGRNN